MGIVTQELYILPEAPQPAYSSFYSSNVSPKSACLLIVRAGHCPNIVHGYTLISLHAFDSRSVSHSVSEVPFA